MASSQDFRNRYVSSVSIAYAADESLGTVLLSIRDANGATNSFQIGGVTEFSIDEDFQSLAIERCTLIVDAKGVYLSLDPFHEGVPSDQDNYWFRGKSILRA
jgi:hypothetical protein